MPLGAEPRVCVCVCVNECVNLPTWCSEREKESIIFLEDTEKY